MQGQTSGLVKQLSELVLMARFVYLASPSKPRLATLPSVQEPASNPAGQKPQKKKGGLASEVQEFMQLPSHIQRQVLDYAKNWISASFERTD